MTHYPGTPLPKPHAGTRQAARFQGLPRFFYLVEDWPARQIAVERISGQWYIAAAIQLVANHRPNQVQSTIEVSKDPKAKGRERHSSSILPISS